MKALRNLGLASIVAGSTLFSGCETPSSGPNYARNNEIAEQKALGFLGVFSDNPFVNVAGRLLIDDAQKKERNDAIRNMGRGNESANQGSGEGNSNNFGIRYDTGEIIEYNHSFGNVYACVALNRIGGKSNHLCKNCKNCKNKNQFIAKNNIIEKGPGSFWFYMESTGSFADPKLVIYNLNNGNQILESGLGADKSKFYDFALQEFYRDSLPVGNYTIVVTGQRIKPGFMFRKPKGDGPQLKVIEFPFTVK